MGKIPHKIVQSKLRRRLLKAASELGLHYFLCRIDATAVVKGYISTELLSFYLEKFRRTLTILTAPELISNNKKINPIFWKHSQSDGDILGMGKVCVPLDSFRHAIFWLLLKPVFYDHFIHERFAAKRASPPGEAVPSTPNTPSGDGRKTDSER